MSRRKAGPAMARGAVPRKRQPPTTSEVWVTLWKGFDESKAVYVGNGKFTDNIKLAKTWPSREEAVKAAKKRFRNRPFGDPSWKQLFDFVKVSP